jgi:protein-L-isoaspartate(D-aspartate) O-methyltransferase
MTDIHTHRIFFSQLITSMVGIPPVGSRVAAAFAYVPREKFVGPGPWNVFTPTGYLQTPSDDPSLLYQDITVALKSESRINNGQPTLHSLCINALSLREGEKVIHIGTGTGYYTAIRAYLVGPEGQVVVFEIDSDLARRSAENLAHLPNVMTHSRSGADGSLPPSDVIYVNAGATRVLDIWLDALALGGRLLFPLTPKRGAGGMLLVTRTEAGFAARFISPVMFTPCIGARDDMEAEKLSVAFEKGGWKEVKALKRNSEPDPSCWLAGDGWWLSINPLNQPV